MIYPDQSDSSTFYTITENSTCTFYNINVGDNTTAQSLIGDKSVTSSYFATESDFPSEVPYGRIEESQNIIMLA